MVPIILYASEIWGIYNIDEVDKLHFKFCKTILGVRPQTSNAAVLGELGRCPLSIICKQRALSHRVKIKQNPLSLMHTVYIMNNVIFTMILGIIIKITKLCGVPLYHYN